MTEAKKRILAIDDDSEALDLIRNALESGGFEVLTAADGRKGVEKAAAARPDLILLDVVMPGMDGWDTCDALRALPGFSHLPIIFLTNVDLPSSLYQSHGAFETDWDEYITKPFKPKKRVSVVKAALSR
jgi:CheY-like chemotaxis protein